MENILSNMIDMTDMDRLIKRAGIISSLARIGRKVPTRSAPGKAPIKDIPLSGPSPVRSGHHRQPFYTEEQARMADELGHTRLPTRAEFEFANGPRRGSSSANDYAKEYEAAMQEYRRQRAMGGAPMMEEIDLSPQARTPKPPTRGFAPSTPANDYAKEYDAAMQEYRRQRAMGMGTDIEEIDLSPQAITPKPRRHRQPFYTEEQARMADELGHTRFPTRAEFESINGPSRPVQNNSLLGSAINAARINPKFDFGTGLSKFRAIANNPNAKENLKKFMSGLWRNSKPFLLGAAGGTLAGSFDSPSERKIDSWQPYNSGNPNMLRSQYVQRPLPDISKLKITNPEVITGDKKSTAEDVIKMLDDYFKSRQGFAAKSHLLTRGANGTMDPGLLL